jgi:tetratricopeptide (TPR) repeat protein
MKSTARFGMLIMLALSACGGVEPTAATPTSTASAIAPTARPTLPEMPRSVSECQGYAEVQLYQVAIYCYEVFIAPGAESSEADKTVAYLRIGALEHRLGNYDVAIERLVSGLKIAEPGSADQLNYYVWLGWSLKANGQITEACAMFHQTLELATKLEYQWVVGNTQTQIRSYCE